MIRLQFFEWHPTDEHELHGTGGTEINGDAGVGAGAVDALDGAQTVFVVVDFIADLQVKVGGRRRRPGAAGGFRFPV